MNGKMARKIGMLYFLVILAGIACEIIMHNLIVIPGDISATVQNILRYEPLFRLGFVFSLVRFIVFILLVLALYKFLRPVHQSLALVMLVLALGSIFIGMVSLLFQFGAPLLLSKSAILNGIPTTQILAQVEFFQNLQTMGDKTSQILAIWLLPLGLLIYKSGFLPKLLGVVMVIAGVGYVTDALIFILVPQLNWQLAGFAFLGELPFPIWLLIKGSLMEKRRSNMLKEA